MSFIATNKEGCKQIFLRTTDEYNFHTHTGSQKIYTGPIWPLGNELHLKPNEKPHSHRLVENEQLQD